MSNLARSIERAATKKNKKADGGGDYHILIRIAVFAVVLLAGVAVTLASSAYVEVQATEFQKFLVIFGGILLSIVLGIVSAVTMKKPVEVASRKYKMPKERSSWVQVRKQKV